jgi:Fungal specific transcription factor domain
MMFGIIKHQVGQRNKKKEQVNEAVQHFITAMTYFSWLLQAQTLSHVQALAILSLFARNYQKPEAAWFVIYPAVWAAIELGLNRSVSTLPEDERRLLTPHDVEMRKRIFWVIFGIAAGISGRLGRPLPLRIQDIDVEFPEPLHDYLPEETDLTEFQKCSFIVSIVGSKLSALMAQLYSNTFGLRRNVQTYEADLAQLEREYQVWVTRIPPELADPDKATASAKIFAIYVRLWDLEFQFFLHHPVFISRQHYSTAGLKKCLDICDKFLPLINELRILRCLDCQWIFVSLLLAVIFTILFVYDVREPEVTADDLKKLQDDMTLWQDILGAVGEMQGILLWRFIEDQIY